MTNTGFKSLEVEELLNLNLKKQKVMVLFQDSKRSSTETTVSGSFTQDGETHSNRYANSALCKGRSFALKSRKATYLFNTHASLVVVGLINISNPILLCALKTLYVTIVIMLCVIKLVLLQRIVIK